MNLSTAELAALEAGSVRIGVFFRLETDPIVRVWLGVGAIEPGVNVYDISGASYDGLGAITSVPPFRQLINGKAERVDFTVSGVSGEILQVASGGDPEQVKGKRVAVGFALMAEDWSLLGAIKWCANYTADYLSIRQEVTNSPQAPIVRTISLSCGTLLTGRRRPSFSYFTDYDQQARFPGDLFCQRVSVYVNGFSKTWPTFPPP